ncbi:MAG TPA: magnesium transporter [Burkholderiales bacterium]|jgi:magnesium transporter|nr:magnesium transporter [Burkholderiales bacterium]
MPEALARLEVEDLQQTLRDIEPLAADKSKSTELRARLDALHPADIAFLLEALPLEERQAVWNLVKADRDGEILVEVSEAVRESLIESMDSAELVAAAETLEADELADIAADLPAGVMEEVVRSLPLEERARLRAALSYPEGSVGALMDFEHVAVRDDVTMEAATRYLRRMDELPGHTDQLFVIDRAQRLKGSLPLARIIVTDLEHEVSKVMIADSVRFHPEDSAEDAASAFERYDLVSAPVVDAADTLIGRLTVNAVVDHIRERSAESRLAEAGLRQEEDVFAPILDSFKNRWSWLALNLVTAFIASRVIGLFEGSIERLVALAALMPIVAGVGGNSGNQTITMIVRALALGQISGAYWRQLLAKEIGVALLNGVVWGCLLGVVAYVFYGNVALGGVMALAMLLNLVLAATMGVAIPWIRERFGRDPAVGSSVLITACTDSGGFFIFLGLATLFLM